MSISLCMITKNEEKLLPDFLNHHSILFDEIIVVDTGSTDKTIEIAKKFTDKVFNFRWNNDFSAARNFSIQKAAKDWIIWLDPDEKIDKNDFEKIRQLIQNKNFLGYSFIQKNYTNAVNHPRFEKEKGGEFEGYFVRRICKLFQNNKKIRFEYPVHETVKNAIDGLNGKIGKSEINIEHFAEKKNKKELKEKEELYLKLLEKKKREFPESNAEKEIESEEKIRDYFLR